MREIKFRAWQDDKMLIQKDTGVYGTKIFLSKCYQDCVLEQYTGIKDRNGKEVYEGDFLTYGADKQQLLLEVEFDVQSASFGVIMYLGGKIHRRGFLLNIDMEVAKTVGNIHENPELLEKP